MGLLAVTDRPADVAERQQSTRGRWAVWLIPAAYVLLAMGMTWRLWRDPAAMAPSLGSPGVSRDISLNAWFMRYAATAVSHGHLPALITTAMNFPQGVSAMWNTSVLLPAVLLAPVTLLAGPMASLTVLLTLGFAGSAAALFVVLRRWGASVGAAGVGGALYGFSPAMMVAAGDHYHLQFAVLPPLIIDAALRLATGRGHPVRTGIWLGLLVAAQIFIAEELLVDTALACLAFLITLAICQPVKVLRVLRRPFSSLRKTAVVAGGLAIAIAIALVLTGHALYVQFHGPLAEHGSPWHLGKFGSQPADFVTAPDVVLLHGQFPEFVERTRQYIAETFAYLGWPLLSLLLVVTVVFWRDVRVRVSALAFLLLELLSMGGHRIHVGTWQVPFYLQPWHWLWHLPVIGQIVPSRISIIADGVAAAVLAFGIDGVRAVARKRKRRWRIPLVAASAVAGLAVLVPIIPLPVPTVSVAGVPSGWRTVINDLHPRQGAPVLVLPVDGARTMQIQAITGESFAVVGGYCIVRGPGGRAAQCDTATTLSPAQQTSLLRFNLLADQVPGARGPAIRTAALAIADWRPDLVIALASSQSPLGRYLISVLGPPRASQDNVLGWKVNPNRLARQLAVHDTRAEAGRQEKIHAVPGR